MATYLYRKNTTQPSGFHFPNNFQYCQPHAHFYARDSPESFPEFCMTESPNEQLLTSPPPSPLQPASYFVSVCLTNLSKIKGIMQCLSFGDWLISLSTISSRFIHVVGYDRVFFFSWDWIILHCIYIPYFFSYSSVSGHLGYFLLLAIVNNSLHVILNSVGNCKLLYLQSVSHCYFAFLFLVFSKVVENVHMYWFNVDCIFLVQCRHIDNNKIVLFKMK